MQIKNIQQPNQVYFIGRGVDFENWQETKIKGLLALLGKPQKKGSSTNGQTIKRGVKAGPLRKKEPFFLFCCHLKIKIILL